MPGANAGIFRPEPWCLQAGGTTIIQSEASSLIWGMPRAGRELDAASHELEPGAISRLMTQLAEGK